MRKQTQRESNVSWTSKLDLRLVHGGHSTLFINGTIESILFIFLAKCLPPGVLNISSLWSLRQGQTWYTGCFLTPLWMLVSTEPSLSTLHARSPSCKSHREQNPQTLQLSNDSSERETGFLWHSLRVDPNHWDGRLCTTIPTRKGGSLLDFLKVLFGSAVLLIRLHMLIEPLFSTMSYSGEVQVPGPWTILSLLWIYLIKVSSLLGFP